MSYTLLCTECGNEFVSSFQRAKYCSAECSRKAENRRAREKRKLKSIIEKQCAYCGKAFYTYSDHIRYCNKSCSAQGRKMEGAVRERQYETANIRITKPLDGVYPQMMPEVGSVHKAEKSEITRWLKHQVYIIRSIGRHGLLVRADECEEVDEDVIE